MKSKAVSNEVRKKPTKKLPKTATRTNLPRIAKRLTDPKKVHHPVMASIHSALVDAYKVNQNLPMCFIFDYVSPARLFKRGTTYNRATPFVQWTPKELAEATETDEANKKSGNATLMPFDPKPYS